MHPRSGGPPAVVAGSAKALVELGHEVEVLSTALPGDERVVRATWANMLAAGVTLTFCAEEGLPGFVGLSRQKDLISDKVKLADVVHLHGVWNPIFLIAGRVAHAEKIPYFVSVHGVFDHRAMNRLLLKRIKKHVSVALFRFRPFLERAAGVVYGSQSEADQSWHLSPKLKLIFVPNGVDAAVGKDRPTHEQMERLYEVLPQTRYWTRTVLCRSRLHEEKGIDMLVEAFNKVAPEFPDAHLMIAGIEQDKAFEARLASLIENGPAPDRIAVTTKMTGPSSQFMYKVGSIFAMPSIAEGFSVALIEGLAHERPILLTRYCHMGIVEEAGGGLVAEPTIASIAEKLRVFLGKSDDELQAMGRSSRMLFEEKYTWARVADTLIEKYSAGIAKKCGYHGG